MTPRQLLRVKAAILSLIGLSAFGLTACSSTPAPAAQTSTAAPVVQTEATPAALPATPTPTTVPPTATPSAAATEEDLVRQSFERYRSALLNKDGQAAAESVDQKTIDWYGEALAQALDLPPAELDQLDFLRKLTVLRLRHQFRREQLEALTGEELFVQAVELGWISRDEVEDVELAEVSVEGNEASLSIQAAPDTPVFFFVKEGSEWNFALWKAFPLAEQFFEQSLVGSGLTEKEYLLNLLEFVSQSEVDEKIFEGPLE